MLLQAIRIVECPEFRDLCMLLRESLTDKDIPHRDKLREAIFQEFHKAFGNLKTELSVSHITDYRSQNLLIRCERTPLDGLVSPLISGLIKTCVPF